MATATAAVTITFTDTPANLVTLLQGFCKNQGFQGNFSDIAAMTAFYKASIIAYTLKISENQQRNDAQFALIPILSPGT